LIPRELVSDSYTEDDIFVTQEDLVLKPETTAPSYLYAQALMNSHNKMKVKPPFVVWQHSRSARNEQDNVLKNMRLKEFYQLEFQILFSETTMNDYYPSIVNAMRDAASMLIGSCRTEPSDRVPSYSTETTDIVCEKSDMEICSMSRRLDFPNSKIKVIEVAFGTDRCVYNFLRKDF
jgi:glycyl-tRNA synthetase